MSSTAQHQLLVSTPDGDVNIVNISHREYIYFLPYPLPPDTPVPYSTGLPDKNPLDLPSHQFEPTSTLVLTSPKRIFVDVRLFKPFFLEDPTPLPNKGQKRRLEWAFAGSSSSRPLTAAEEEVVEKNSADATYVPCGPVTHSTWTHWLDSRYTVGDPDIPVDEGDMYPISDILTLEHGHAFHPHLNAVKSHEELWRDGEVHSTNTAETKVCIVLRCQDDDAGVRGVVIRLGQYCQGILMKGNDVTVERWEWEGTIEPQEYLTDLELEEEEPAPDTDRVEAGNEEVAQWKRTARVGDLFIPCAAAIRSEVLGLGAKVRYFDYEWVVEEAWEWK